jgi:hypothetical protein
VSTLAAIPSVLVLIPAACCVLVIAVAGRDRSNHAEAISRADRCRARPVFAELQTASFVVDALIEASDDLTVPFGMPFSLRLVPPDRSDDYLFSRLRATVERGHPFSVEVEEGDAGRTARLCANGWMTVLRVERTSGWPSTAPI